MDKTVRRIPWTEKYRPTTISEVVNHDNIIKTIKNMMENKCVIDFMFYGPPGTGKTSTIVAFGKDLYGSDFSLMTMIMNASDSGRIDNIRNQIREFIGVDQRSVCRKIYPFKLIILDEVDAMSHEAQIVLQKLMEENHKTTLFCLICNYYNKIIKGLVSRCALFRFKPLVAESIKHKIDGVIKTENLQLSQDTITSLVELSKGDMRKVLNILHACFIAYGKDISHQQILSAAGTTEVKYMVQILIYLMNLHYGNINLKSAIMFIESLVMQYNINIFHLIEFILATLEKMDISIDEITYFIAELADFENILNASGDSQKIDYLCSIFVLYPGKS